MAMQFTSGQKAPGKSRKLSFLPRVGLYVDVFDREFTLKYAPFLELVANLADRGFTAANLAKVTAEQLAEIEFPGKSIAKTVKTSARTISVATRKKKRK